MAVKLLSGYIAAQLAKHLGPHVLAGVLVKVTPGTRGATLTGGTNPTDAQHECRLWLRTYDAREIDGTSIKVDDREIAILGASIADGAVPAPNDKVVAEDKIWRIVGEPGGRGVRRDPDAAVYRCHARYHADFASWSSGFSNGFGG